MTEQQSQSEKDAALWQIAEKRVKFKNHLLIYIIINSFLWALWFFTDNTNEQAQGRFILPWPVWSMFGWGIGLAFQYAAAYTSATSSALQNEYNKLKNKSLN